MRKFLTKAIPIVTIALFVCIMLSGSILKKPLGKNDNVQQYIDDLIQDVNEEAWDDVRKEVEELDRAWKKIIVRVQFSVEMDEMNYLSTSVCRLRGAAAAEDKAGALMELYEVLDYWEQLGR